ncbi:MAG: GH92 family glycosyl hydrolase [Bacteroidales bacterium]|jgi:predicted alpha-1,2-mannosidase|nr:glycoside hydrolase family 92 protein [Bacteroidales bacterium]
MKKVFVFLLASFFAFSQTSVNSQNLTKYVNPFIGTDAHGHTYPGAQVPFGFMQLSPDTRLEGWDGASGYHYTDSVIFGFSHTHLSGTGVSDYNDILIMPALGVDTPVDYAFKSSFKKENESAAAGYYSVLLDRYQVMAEMTATERCGMHKYTFPRNKPQNSTIFIDLEHRDEVLESYIEIINDTEIVGFRRSKAWADDQHVYFVIQFSQPMLNFEIWNNNEYFEGIRSLNSKNIKARFDFPFANKGLHLRVGISGVDIEGARKNLQEEMPHWNFDQYKAAADEKWQKALSKIVIEDPNEAKKTAFYTALYHSMISLNIYNDVDGRYRGRDNKIHKTDGWNYYTVFSLWDTYRTLHPLLNILEPERTRDFIRTMIAQWEQGGLLPMWELSANETDCMIGYHSVPVIYDAWKKGITDFDINKAFEAMKTSAMQKRLGIDMMDEIGYVLSDFEHESVSKTLEYAFDDWIIAQLAKDLGKTEDYNYFIRRAQGYKNVFDKETGFMRPRFNGGWFSPFDPAEVNNHYTEGNSWHYTFYVPQDFNTYIKMMGGDKAMEKKIDELFQTDVELSGRPQVDITGLIGQYAQGNEPSHHMAYLYNYVGKPYKTQFYARKIMEELYTDQPDGLSGNEDCGQMSAWLVMSALGFYPVTPGTQDYIIGSPLFQKATIDLGNGKTFVIEGKDNSKENVYFTGIKLNGREHTKSYITFEELIKGGNMVYNMTNKPNKKWASKRENRPVTEIIDEDYTLSPIISAKSHTFKGSQLVKINSPQKKKVNTYYTTDGSEPNAQSAKYKKPISIDKTTTIKAMCIDANSNESVVSEATYFLLPPNVKVELSHEFVPQYNAGGGEGLVDGIRGTTNWRLGNWQGYQLSDFEAIVDFGEEQTINEFGAGFLQDTRAWILMPKFVEFYYSNDGVDWTKAGKVNSKKIDSDYDISIEDIVLKMPNSVKARYVKYKATNYGTLPSWHVSYGERAYIFVDEVWVK